MRRLSHNGHPKASGETVEVDDGSATMRREPGQAPASRHVRRERPHRIRRSAATDPMPPCVTCEFAGQCLVALGHADLEPSHDVVRRAWSCAAGDVVIRRGDALREVHVVRTGGVKAFVLASDGREQVLGFHLPGELVGLAAIHLGSHPGDVVALESSEFCGLSFEDVLTVSSQAPRVQQQLLHVISGELSRASQLAGDLNAEERVASFLLDLQRRGAGDQRKDRPLRLTMSRTDMANYLRLASETVSRVFSRFRARGWLEVTGRNVRLLDADALHRVCRNSPGVDS